MLLDVTGHSNTANHALPGHLFPLTNRLETDCSRARAGLINATIGPVGPVQIDQI